MDEISLGTLGALLAVLLILSGLFSGSETGLMALNRYRLRHLAQKGHGGAVKAAALLERPDRVIGLILLGNNFVNVSASSIATLLGLKLLGEEIGLAVAAVSTTVLLLIFGEVMPKTFAALKPERVAFPAAYVLTPLMRVLYPLVWVVNYLANAVLGVFGIRPEDSEEMPLSREELRTVVKEAGAIIPRRHQQMLFGILDLEKVTVEDIMVPRADIIGIDLDLSPAEIADRIAETRHTRLLVYRGSVDNLLGILHVRRLPRLYEEHEHLTAETIQGILSEPYYVPAGTPLHTQLLNFQRRRERIGLVVDEYGDIEGLVTLEDLLEEIVGEFTTDTQAFSRELLPQEDGTYLVDGSMSLRELNRRTRWKLPTHSSKTLNGLILETLESIPEPGTTVRIGGHTVEVLQMSGQTVKMARVTPVVDVAPAPDAGQADG